MEHRWGHRLSSDMPVRLRCVGSRDSGCRCLGFLRNVSATGALISTEPGIHPAPDVVVELLAPCLGMQGRELPAAVVRKSSTETAVEWMETASAGVSAMLIENMLVSREEDGEQPAPALNRVRYCALAPAGGA
jgi:hypothetical protein